jgi:endoglucanase
LTALALGALSACGGPAAPPETAANASAPSDDAPIAEAPKPPKATGNPLKGQKLWVDPESLAQLRANALRATAPDKAALLDKIAKQPQALWLGEWNSDVFRKVQFVVDAAAKDGALPIFIAYNVPGRDCGQHSAGGLKTGDMYRRWIRKVAAGIGDRGAVVILEPDSLGLVDKCLTPEQEEERMKLLHDAIKVLRQNPKTIVYLDGLHSKWAEVDVIVERLKRAGVEDAHGFAINTSNYRPDDELIPYGKAVSEKLGGAHFVIDTSRNGAGAAGVEWCNPPGRKLGKPPTTETGDELIDGFLWLKRPGESDGECNGGPRAGVFWDERAFEMAQ